LLSPDALPAAQSRLAFLAVRKTWGVVTATTVTKKAFMADSARGVEGGVAGAAWPPPLVLAYLAGPASEPQRRRRQSRIFPCGGGGTCCWCFLVVERRAHRLSSLEWFVVVLCLKVDGGCAGQVLLSSLGRRRAAAPQAVAVAVTGIFTRLQRPLPRIETERANAGARHYLQLSSAGH